MPHVYMLVTQDKYELPLMVADTATELARKLGLSKDSVASAICKAKKDGRKCKYVRVELDDW